MPNLKLRNLYCSPDIVLIGPYCRLLWHGNGLCLSWNQRNFSISWVNARFSSRTLHHGVVRIFIILLAPLYRSERLKESHKVTQNLMLDFSLPLPFVLSFYDEFKLSACLESAYLSVCITEAEWRVTKDYHNHHLSIVCHRMTAGLSVMCFLELASLSNACIYCPSLSLLGGWRNIYMRPVFIRHMSSIHVVIRKTSGSYNEQFVLYMATICIWKLSSTAIDQT
jgi:hypothetical protein